jgi:hypothetical protein
MDGTPQNTPDTTGNAPTPDLYGQMKAAGFGDEELKGYAPKQANAPEAPTPQEAPAPSPVVEKTPTIPPPPAPVPGIYSPEKEQRALYIADAITDPEMRMKMKANIKREYANDAMMDGITGKAREEGIKTGVASYSSAIYQLRNDTKLSLEQKHALVKALTDTMWKDPRLEYGETKGHLETFMQKLAFGEDDQNLGPLFADGFHGIVTGKISSSQQILEMMDNGSLTWAGGQKLVQALGTKDKPDQAALQQRQSYAQQEIKNMVMKDTDENNPLLKPSPKQYDKLNQLLYALNDQIRAAGQDQKRLADVTSRENVKELVEQAYPWYERNADTVTRGSPQALVGIAVPPTVARDDKSQIAYRDIIAVPPTLTGKDGKSVQVPQANWQKGIEVLRQTGQVDNFNKAFQTDKGARILRALPYVAPPPTIAPTPTPAQSPGFMSTLGARLFPPAGEGVKSLQLDTGKTPIADAITRGLNVISPVPGPEAKK